MKAVTFPTRVIAMLGVKNFIATNASGLINKNFSSGDVIAVRDHINFMGTNPLIGENDERWNVRFPDMSNAYNKEMLDILKRMGLKTGVYAAFTGPSEKRVLIGERNRLYNKYWTSRCKTAVKNVIALVEAGNKDEAAKSFNVAQSVIDKAVVKGVMHKNTAARRKELMARRLKTLSV